MEESLSEVPMRRAEMKRYTMQDCSTGVATRTDTDLTLFEVYEMTDWSAKEFDAISELKVNEEVVYCGIKVQRIA